MFTMMKEEELKAKGERNLAILRSLEVGSEIFAGLLTWVDSSMYAKTCYGKKSDLALVYVKGTLSDLNDKDVDNKKKYVNTIFQS